MSAEMTQLLEWVREQRALAIQFTTEWAAANPGCEQAVYRDGIWYGLRQVEREILRTVEVIPGGGR